MSAAPNKTSRVGYKRVVEKEEEGIELGQRTL